MTRHDHSPLTPEERALADRLARLGPHGGPPAALDAKILAAAHEAVAVPPRRNRRRWLGLSGGAGGLVTGVGLAASLTLVLGVVWQLRPHDQTLTQMREGPANEAEHVILVDALPSSEPRTRIVEPPGESSAAAPAAAADLASAAPKGAAGAEPERALRAEPAAPAPQPAADAEQQLREQSPAAATRTRQALPRREASALSEDAAPAAFPASAPVDPAPASAAPPAPAPMLEAPAEPSVSRRATYTRAARAQAERAEKAAAPATGGAADNARMQGILSAPAAQAYSSAPAPMAADTADAMETVELEAVRPAAVEHDGTTLDRVEVTGSRSLGANADVGAIPLHMDRSLAPADWLERIRARRAAGDSDAARKSLESFRKAHPRIRLPDDLLELLETTDPDPAGTP